MSVSFFIDLKEVIRLLFLVNGIHRKPCLAGELLDVKFAPVPRACVMEGHVGVCELDEEDMRQTPLPTVSAGSQGGRPVSGVSA